MAGRNNSPKKSFKDYAWDAVVDSKNPTLPGAIRDMTRGMLRPQTAEPQPDTSFSTSKDGKDINDNDNLNAKPEHEINDNTVVNINRIDILDITDEQLEDRSQACGSNKTKTHSISMNAPKKVSNIHGNRNKKQVIEIVPPLPASYNRNATVNVVDADDNEEATDDEDIM